MFFIVFTNVFGSLRKRTLFKIQFISKERKKMGLTIKLKSFFTQITLKNTAFISQNRYTKTKFFGNLNLFHKVSYLIGN